MGVTTMGNLVRGPWRPDDPARWRRDHIIPEARQPDHTFWYMVLWTLVLYASVVGMFVLGLYAMDYP